MSLCPFEEYEKRRKEFEEENERTAGVCKPMNINVSPWAMASLEALAVMNNRTVEVMASRIINLQAMLEEKRQKQAASPLPKRTETKPASRRSPRRIRRARR